MGKSFVVSFSFESKVVKKVLGGTRILLGGFWTAKLFPLIDARLLSKTNSRCCHYSHFPRKIHFLPSNQMKQKRIQQYNHNNINFLLLTLPISFIILPSSFPFHPLFLSLASLFTLPFI